MRSLGVSVDCTVYSDALVQLSAHLYSLLCTVYNTAYWHITFVHLIHYSLFLSSPCEGGLNISPVQYSFFSWEASKRGIHFTSCPFLFGTCSLCVWCPTSLTLQSLLGLRQILCHSLLPFLYKYVIPDFAVWRKLRPWWQRDKRKKCTCHNCMLNKSLASKNTPEIQPSQDKYSIMNKRVTWSFPLYLLLWEYIY